MNDDTNIVSYVAFESACTRLERNNRRLFILCLVLIFALIATNVAWVVYENQFEDVEVTQEVEQETDSGGSNHSVGGDYYGATEE